MCSRCCSSSSISSCKHISVPEQKDSLSKKSSESWGGSDRRKGDRKVSLFYMLIWLSLLPSCAASPDLRAMSGVKQSKRMQKRGKRVMAADKRMSLQELTKRVGTEEQRRLCSSSTGQMGLAVQSAGRGNAASSRMVSCNAPPAVTDPASRQVRCCTEALCGTFRGFPDSCLDGFCFRFSRALSVPVYFGGFLWLLPFRRRADQI